ncbi:hypothetical protein [Streptomyces xiaopingdaonensis]|uniref:hypothetical protein n=1 Tax=Streptomyces xiaopingdaonensis TaxID=1565415 RepID=UPI000314F2B8|nr:hypothetical protein [Streptomyces xiaopingdaonensis]
MRRARTTDRSMSSFLLLLIAVLFGLLCVHGQTGLQGESGRAVTGAPVVGMAQSPSEGGDVAPAEHGAHASAADETVTDGAEILPADGGSCPERKAPEQSGSPHVAAPALAELPSPGEVAETPRAARWLAHSEEQSAKAPPPRVSVLRI